MTDEQTSQHVNPILVFVNDETFRKALNCAIAACKANGAVQQSLPKAIGVTDCGKLEFAQDRCHYALLLVHDDFTLVKEVTNAPCKICTSEPLLIVKHINSHHNRGPWNNGIWAITSAIVCEEFSHAPDSPIFRKICIILRSQNNPTEVQKATTALVQSLRNKNILGALDGLAAICQVRLLGEHDGKCDWGALETLERNCLEVYPGIPRDEYGKKCSHDKLSMIQEHANRILGLVPDSAS